MDSILGMFQTTTKSFGGYMFGILALLFLYIALSAVAPEYVPGIALVTVLGIVLYHMKNPPATHPAGLPPIG